MRNKPQEKKTVDAIQEWIKKEKKKEIESEVDEDNENKENTNINNNIIDNNKNSSNSEGQIFVRVLKEQVILTNGFGTEYFPPIKVL